MFCSQHHLLHTGVIFVRTSSIQKSLFFQYVLVKVLAHKAVVHFNLDFVFYQINAAAIPIVGPSAYHQ